MTKLMVFPSIKHDQIKLMKVPDDFEEHEAYRCATSVISELQESNKDCTWEDVEDVLEENGFVTVEHVLGPELLCRS